MAAALRQVLLLLMQSLLMPTAAASSPAAEAAAKANGTAFVEAGGVQLLVDMLTGGVQILKTDSCVAATIQKKDDAFSAHFIPYNGP